MSAIVFPGVVGGQWERTQVGGKALALSELLQVELPIPAFFVVTPEGFFDSLTAAQAAAFSAAQRSGDIAAVVPKLVPCAGLARELCEAYDRLCPQGELVAVRSSAVDEDSAAHSFAGQLDSFVFVSREQLAAKVAAVWRSAFSERILAYRQQHGLALRPTPPAVLVQRMVPADVAGVAFSADPVSGRRGVTVVSAVFGLGTALVSGEADADTFTLDRAGRVLTRQLAHKRSRHIADGSSVEGVRPMAVEASLADAPTLSDEQLGQIQRLAHRAARHFGRPQDIEWAIHAGTLFLLQSRPITSLGGAGNLPDPDGMLQIWDNANIAESYSGITTPLTFSFARHAYEGVYRQFCRLMGVSEAVIAHNHTVFANMLGLIRGRIYYNLLNWYRLLAMLPGFRVNRGFMEQMMGVKEPLPEEIVGELAAASFGARLLDGARLLRTMGGLMVNHLTLQRQIRAFYRRLEAALAVPDPPLEQLRADELVAHFRHLERQLVTRWDAPLVNDFFAMIFYGLLRKFCTKVDPRGTLQNDLLCAEGGIISTEPAKRIRAMAAMVLPNANLRETLCTGELPAIRRALAPHADLQRAYEGYLEKFGHRCLEELKLESATLHDDPLPLLRSVGQLARRLQAVGDVSQNADAPLRAAAEAQVGMALGGKPLHRAVFNWVLYHTRARVRDRENLRFERTRLFGRVREVFVEMGRRLCAERPLDEPRDVFYLTLEEILATVEGTAVTTDLRALTALRKAEFAGFARQAAPADRFATRGLVYGGNSFAAEGPGHADADAGGAAAGGDTRTGIGCCAGVVPRPGAGVITQPRGAQLQQGDILIALRTDPGWIMLFPEAAGVAVEHGSLLSHSAIVAREMGIPAVVSVSGLTTWIRDGEQVELDGKAGTIRKLACEGTA